MALSEEELQGFNDRYAPAADLGLAVDNASHRDPDRYAEDLSIARESQLPVDTVERNRDEVKRRQSVRAIDSVKLKESHPKTAEYLSDPENASVSYDDIDTLKNLEQVLQNPAHGFWNNLLRSAGEATNKLSGDVIEHAGNLGEDYGMIIDVLTAVNTGQSVTEHGLPVLTAAAELKEFGKAISRPGSYDYVPDFTWDKFKGDPTIGNLVGYVTESTPTSLVHMLSIRRSLPAYIMSRTEAIAEEFAANNQSGDVDSADLIRSVVPAITVSLLENLGAKATLGMGAVTGVKSAGKAVGRAVYTEGGTEFLQEGVEYLGETAGSKKKLSFAEGLDRMVAGAVAGAGTGGAIRTATATGEALVNRTQREVARRQVSEAEQETIDTIISYAQESKTQTRPGEHFNNFINGLDPEDEMYVPQEALKDIPDVPSFLIGRDEIPGTEVSMSVADFITQVIPNEPLLAALRPHVRMSPTTMSTTELKVRETEAKVLVERAEAAKDVRDKVDKIYESIKDQIVGTGRQAERTAKHSAAVIPAYVQSKAERLGIDPETIFNDMVGMAGLKIQGPGVPRPSAPNIVEQAPQIMQQQDFSGVKLEETVTVRETGERAKVTQDAQVVWDRTQKRRSVVEQVAKCL